MKVRDGLTEKGASVPFAAQMPSMTTVNDHVFWVGYVDWTVRDFHGYKTTDGSTYNSYLVKDRQIAVIDAVKAPYVQELIKHIQEVADLASVNWIVVNHAEPDHAGGVPELVKALPNATVVCNDKCKDALSHHFDTTGWKWKVVKEAETLSLGTKTLQFFNTPMVHWPESMATYLVEDKILFSMDAFGQHMASSERFDDQLPLSMILEHAKTYYANIVQLYGRPVQAALAKLGKLPIDVICPSHGIIWRSHISDILAQYVRWAVTAPVKKVVVFFTSMWGSTRQMANEIVRGAQTVPDVEVKLIDIDATHDTTTVTELMDCASFACGTPTLNIGMMPSMARTLTYVKGLRPQGKKGFAFGSYGWAEKGATAAEAMIAEWGAERIRPPLTVRFRPDATVLAECFEAGKQLAEIAAAVQA